MKHSDILSISELARLIQQALEHTGQRLSFTGEISQCTRASSGHIYFTLKDSSAQLSSVMWKGPASSLDFRPEEGLQVVCTGTPNLYPPTGRLQIVVSSMHLAGEGALRLRFEQLKKKLEAEGLFDEERKRALPFLPKRVGVVTSKSGAVIHDISVTIWERMPNTQIILYDARVQGEGAAQEIAAGIEAFNRNAAADVLIIGRGGGSLEDLWPFNEELVSRAVFASKIPVVSAVGHEVDVSLSDLVADLRAPTPTSAAKSVVPQSKDLLERIARSEKVLVDTEAIFGPKDQVLDELVLRLRERVQGRFREAGLELRLISESLRRIEPESLLREQKQRLLVTAKSLQAATARCLNTFSERLATSGSALRRFALAPEPRLRLEGLEKALSRSSNRLLEQKRKQLGALSSELGALGPDSILKRGYALVRSHQGGLLARIEDLEIDTTVGVEMATGSFDAEVKALRIKDKNE